MVLRCRSGRSLFYVYTLFMQLQATSKNVASRGLEGRAIIGI